jgi:hypothetical protein
MQKWEYFVEPCGLEPDSDELNAEMDEKGAQGWEAFGVAPGHCGESFRILYKRAIQ